MFFDVYNNIKLGDHCAPNEIKTQAILAVMNDPIPYQITVPYFLKVSAPDGPGFDYGMIQCCFEFLTFCYNRNLDILIHCWSGRSRSTSVISGWLHILTKRPFEEIAKEILQKRMTFEGVSVANYPYPHPVVYETVRKYIQNKEIEKVKNLTERNKQVTNRLKQLEKDLRAECVKSETFLKLLPTLQKSVDCFCNYLQRHEELDYPQISLTPENTVYASWGDFSIHFVTDKMYKVVDKKTKEVRTEEL